ncbi:MAG: hypothetical protein ACI4LK_08995 [Lentihominibacter sp.]
MIPKNIYEKYHLADIAEYEAESVFYSTFLIQTDFIAAKILEGVATSADYADELYYREIARQELDKLNGGTGEAAQVLPLDASIEKAGANIDYIAMMADIELPEMEV